MKLQLSNSTLKKLLAVTTVANYLLIVTYIFLLISASSISNYFVFLISIPAYVLSNSWVLIIAVFGFEILLITYYWYKNKQTTSLEVGNSVELDDFTEELITDESDTADFSIEFDEVLVDDAQDTELEELLALESDEEFSHNETPHALQEDIAVTSAAEMEFDKLWADAIEHVRLANGDDKKKAQESAPLVNIDLTLKEALSQSDTSKSSQSKPQLPKLPSNKEKEKNRKKSKEKDRLSNSLSLKRPLPDSTKSHSVIQDSHRDFYNEIALNNWIYAKKVDRDRIGKYKIALDETRFREKDISYLFDAGIIFKLLVPHPTGSFAIYSIHEGEDKKLINHYLSDFCKKQKIPYSQKTISIVNYQELGLDKRIWRIDFQIKNEILGLLWISNFLIIDNETKSYSLTFKKKKELKALMAASQLQLKDKQGTALIITAFNEDIEVISNFIKTLGYGQACILAIGEKNFEEEFLKLVKEKVAI